MASQKNPLVLRGWALLHYLDQHREDPQVCRLFYLQTYLRTNWAAAKELVEKAIEENWVEELKEPGRCYRITDAGRKHLVILRDTLSHWYEKEIQKFCMQRMRL